MADPDLEKRGADNSGKGGSQKHFSALLTSLGSETKVGVGQPPGPPPMDPPLHSSSALQPNVLELYLK